MGFFRREENEEDEQATSRARIEAGGIPAGAQARLSALATEGGLFTSGLSVNEFALLNRLGSRTLAQVMGASVVRTGWQYLPALAPGVAVSAGSGYAAGRYAPAGRAWQNRYTEASPGQVLSYQWHAEVVCALDALTDAWNMARRRALERLSEEALLVGADAVVGVALDRGDHDFGKGTVEYVVTGTAIRLPGSTGTSRPVLTDVSVQDYWRLHSAGYEPVGLLTSTAVVFASPPRFTRLRRLRTRGRNQELEEVSRGFQAARETVRDKLRGQVSDARGTGAVGVELSHSVRRDKLALASALGSMSQRGWNRGALGLPYYVSGRADTERAGWVITMHGAGTAVRRRHGPSEFAPETQIWMGAR